MVARGCLTVFRVMCGRRAHSRWLPAESEALEAAVAKGLASTDGAGRTYLGPLVWIEVGRRASQHARTVPLHDPVELEGLPLRNRPVRPHPAAVRRPAPA